MLSLRAVIGSVLVVASLLLVRIFQLSEVSLFWIGLMGVGVVIFAIGLRWVFDGVGVLRLYRDMWPILSIGLVVAWLIHSAKIEDLAAGSWLGQLFGTVTVSVTTLLLRYWGVHVTMVGNVLFLAAPSRVSGLQVTALCGGFLSVLMFSAAFALVLVDFGRVLGAWRLFTLFLIGTFVTLAAALLRVFVVTLAGFYWGFETMMFAHTYLGYVLFLVVVCGFWYSSIEWSTRLTKQIPKT